MAASKKDVAKINEQTGNQMQMFTDKPEWAGDSNRGSEDVGINDIILPRIDILQALSPQLKKSDPAHIPGAEQGVMFNTLSRKLYGQEVNFIPVVFRREYIVWGDRASGGGFNGSFPSEADAQAEVMELQEKGVKAEVTETHVHFILLLSADGSTEEAVLSWSRSKIKASRKLNSLVHMTSSDRFAGTYKLKSIEVAGPKGDYWSADVQFVGYHSRDLFERGLATYKAVQGGGRTVDRSDEIEAAASGVL